MRAGLGGFVGRGWARGLLLAALLPALTSCGYVPVQGHPLIGEGPPPGYLSGTIPEQYRGMRDPFTPADQQAVAAGRALYQAYRPSCDACHGDGGRGDGPLEPYLEPRPADYAAPPMVRAFREHQDYVFWWVSEGVPKTVMPAWKARMNETERWQVITYAWYLAERAPAPAASKPDQEAGARQRPYPWGR